MTKIEELKAAVIELDGLKRAFDSVGGRGVDLADEIDALRADVGDMAVDLLPALLEAVAALDDVHYAFKALANQAADLATINEELNEPWNEGGIAYEASQRVRRVRAQLEKLK